MNGSGWSARHSHIHTHTFSLTNRLTISYKFHFISDFRTLWRLPTTSHHSRAPTLPLDVRVYPDVCIKHQFYLYIILN